MFEILPFANNNTSIVGANFRDFLKEFFNDDFFASPAFTSEMDKFSSDIKETDNEYLVCAKLPGVSKEDISLDYINNNLVIKAIKQENYEDSRDKFFRKASSYSEFSRSFYLENVDKNKIRAKFKNGELDVILPKEIINKNTKSKINIE